MHYLGRVKNGVIVLDEPLNLEDGIEVRVEIPERRSPGVVASVFRQRYAEVIGKAEGLPNDAAENHDHYLYGSPRK